MVRVKHRWFTVEIKSAEELGVAAGAFQSSTPGVSVGTTSLSVLLTSTNVNDFKNSPEGKQALRNALAKRIKSFQATDVADIGQAVRDTVETSFGLIGSGKLLQQFTVQYWNRQLGIFVIKVLWAHDEMWRAALPLLCQIKGIAVRPEVLCDCATFVQARRFLIDYLNRWTGHHYPIINQAKALEFMEQQERAAESMNQ